MPLQVTRTHQPLGKELLDLETAYRHDGNLTEYVRVAYVKPVGELRAMVSLVLVQFKDSWDGRNGVLQAALTPDEVNLVVAALLAAKARIVHNGCRCYLRGTSWLGLLNTVLGCLFNKVLVRVTDSETRKTVSWYWDRADKHPPEGVH